jgi:serine/threonine protein phosphatase PrpC
LGPNIKYLAVYDGHGVNGKEAAQFAKNQIRKQLIEDKKVIINLKDRKEAETYFTELFRKIQKKFCLKSNEYESSGTCIIGVLIIDSHCFIINLGDSRAVIGAKKGESKLAYQMSIDHKANRNDERKRIEQCGGIVSCERNGK